jgi:hypothetical protein
VQIDDKNAPDMRHEYDQLSRDTMGRFIVEDGIHRMLPKLRRLNAKPGKAAARLGLVSASGDV